MAFDLLASAGLGPAGILARAIPFAVQIAKQPPVPSALSTVLRAVQATGTAAPATPLQMSVPQLGPSSGLALPLSSGGASMSLLGNGSDIGFPSSSDFLSGASQLIAAFRSRGSTSSALPGAGFLVAGPGTDVAAEAGRRVGTAIGTRIRSGFVTKKRRRINPLNVRAARRAIRRIKAVRKITAQIERALPTRRVMVRGSPGVITRAEASRALRR